MRKRHSVSSPSSPTVIKKAPSPKLEIVYEFDWYAKRLPGPLQLLRDQAGGWYLGDEGKPARKVTVTEALEWFCDQEPRNADASGSLGPLVVAAAQLLKREPVANGAGFPVTIKPLPLHAGPDQVQAWSEARERAFKARREVKVPLTVRVGLYTYGLLSEASIIHGCTPEAALDLFIEHTDELHNWCEFGCPTVEEKEPRY